MQNSETIKLMRQSGSPIMVTWTKPRYRHLITSVVNGVCQTIAEGNAIKNNGLNVFNEKRGLPMEVSFPPVDVARSLATEFSEWIVGWQRNFDDGHVASTYHSLKFGVQESIRVFPEDSRYEPFLTAQVIFEYLTNERG